MCVLQLFERNVCAFPDALAIACEGRQLTYRELNSTAEQIADGLREAGVASGCLVGVLLDRSPEMVAALLGIWKAGGGLRPARSGGSGAADCLHAGGRLSFVCAHPQKVGWQPSRRSSFARSVVCWIWMTFALGEVHRAPREARFPQIGLAYVIYTSGSTGKPKGAAITHGGLANTIRGVGDDLNLGPEDVVLAWSTIAFDVACLEIYLPLAFGASLYLVEHE